MIRAHVQPDGNIVVSFRRKPKILLVPKTIAQRRDLITSWSEARWTWANIWAYEVWATPPGRRELLGVWGDRPAWLLREPLDLQAAREAGRRFSGFLSRYVWTERESNLKEEAMGREV